MSDVHPSWYLALMIVVSSGSLLMLVGSSWLKITIVLSFIRQGIGLQSIPGPLISAILALLLSAIIMAPIAENVGRRAVVTFKDTDFRRELSAIDVRDGLTSLGPLIDFYKKHSNPVFLAQLNVENQVAIGGVGSRDSVKFSALWGEVKRGLAILAAFILSELSESCLLGLKLLLPFLVLEIVVSNILTALGMFMLAPQVISLPLKLLLFSVADGWRIFLEHCLYSYDL